MVEGRNWTALQDVVEVGLGIKTEARSFSNNGWLCPVAEGERSEGRGGGLRGTSTRSHGPRRGAEREGRA